MNLYALISVSDKNSYQEIPRFRYDSNAIVYAVAPQAAMAASASGTGQIELISGPNRDQRRRFKGQGRISGLSLSPEGRTLAATSENGTVELWDTETLKRKALLHGVILGYHSVTFSPDGQRLAAGSNGHEAIKLWDADSCDEVATLAGEGSFFRGTRFSPDGNTITSRNWNGVSHFWHAPSWAEIETAERARPSSAIR
jgi:WD40 repeat protein